MGKVRGNSRSRVLGKGTASEDPKVGLGLEAGWGLCLVDRQAKGAGRDGAPAACTASGSGEPFIPW